MRWVEGGDYLYSPCVLYSESPIEVVIEPVSIVHDGIEWGSLVKHFEPHIHDVNEQRLGRHNRLDRICIPTDVMNDRTD